MLDLIGDVHGHADELVARLSAMGYQRGEKGFAHPAGRRVVFLGDFIDRGPQVERVLKIVRAMVDAGQAVAVIGNHEFNAIAYHTPDPDQPGGFLRPHTEKNRKQHRATLDQLGSTLGGWVDWFRTLPPYREVGAVRAVHACWDDEAIATSGEAFDAAGGWSQALMVRASRKHDPLYAATELVLKGREIPLPAGVRYVDKGGDVRTAMRCKWYAEAAGKRYSDYVLGTDAVPCDEPIPQAVTDAARPYPPGAPPVFVGHYWLRATRPAVLADNVACLDYSVARRGALCAYRWDGEARLSDDKLCWTPAIWWPAEG